MMRLYLVRHGVAVDREDPNCPPDTERPLTPKGMKKSHAAALGLFALGRKARCRADQPVAARRANRRNLLRSDGLFLQQDHPLGRLKGTSTPAELLRELAKMKAKEVMCFGHEPHLHLVIGQILHTSARITELKKAGVACLDLERISPPHGQLVALYPPKTLRLLAK